MAQDPRQKSLWDVVETLKNNAKTENVRSDEHLKAQKLLISKIDLLLIGNERQRREDREKDRESRVANLPGAPARQKTLKGEFARGALGDKTMDFASRLLSTAFGFGGGLSLAGAGLAIARIAGRGLRYGVIGLALNKATQTLMDAAFENLDLPFTDEQKEKIGQSLNKGISYGMTAKFLGLKTRNALGIAIGAAVAPYALSALENYFDPDGKKDGKFTMKFTENLGLPPVEVDLSKPEHKLIADGLAMAAGMMVMTVLPKVIWQVGKRMPIILAGWMATGVGKQWLRGIVKGVWPSTLAELDRMGDPSSRRSMTTTTGRLVGGNPFQNVDDIVDSRSGLVRRGGGGTNVNADAKYVKSPRTGKYHLASSPQGKMIIAARDTSTITNKIQGPGVDKSTGKTGKLKFIANILRAVSKGLLPLTVFVELAVALSDEERKKLGVIFPVTLLDNVLRGGVGMVDMLINFGIWSWEGLSSFVTGSERTKGFRSNMSGHFNEWRLGHHRSNYNESVRGNDSYASQLFQLMGFSSQAERGAAWQAQERRRKANLYHERYTMDRHGLDELAENVNQSLYDASVGNSANSWTNLRKGAKMPWENFNYQNTGINGVPMVVDSSVSTVNQNSHPILTGSTATNIDDTYIWTGGPVGQGM